MKVIPFTPGPLRPSKAALDLLADPPATHHREQPFIDMMQKTQIMLRELIGFRFPNDYHATVLTCTGTGANESALLALNRLGRGLILSNGYFGDRLIEQAKALGFHGTDKYIANPNRPFDLAHVDRVLDVMKHAGTLPSWAYFVAHETRAGLKNPTANLAELLKAYGMRVAVDAVSAAFAYPFYPGNIDLLVASSAKAINSVPGLGIVFVKRQFADSLLPFTRNAYYLDLLDEYRQQSTLFRPAFAQPVALHAALHGACNHLINVGITKHHDRINGQMERIHKAFGEHAIESVLDWNHCSKVVANFRLPKHMPYSQFAATMYERGYYLLCGIPDDSTHFQVSTMGDVTDAEVDGLIETVISVLCPNF